jgi:hypothetical protein
VGEGLEALLEALLVLALYALPSVVAGIIWSDKGGPFGTGFAFGLLAWFGVLLAVILTPRTPVPPAAQGGPERVRAGR